MSKCDEIPMWKETIVETQLNQQMLWNSNVEKRLLWKHN